MEFEWDTNKEKSNLKKHGISFVAAAHILLAEHYEAQSDRHSEVRYLAIGEKQGRILAVVYTRRGSKYRIISARRASKNEEKIYRKHCQIQS